MEVTDDIRQAVSELLTAYINQIDDTGHKASGKLDSTAKFNCTFNGRWFEVIFNLQDYWKYLENGTRPHWPPISAIERWIVVKRIVPSTSNGKVPTTKQLAYQIAHSISKKGTKATKVLQSTINSADAIIDNIIDAIFNQIDNEINNEIDEELNENT